MKRVAFAAALAACVGVSGAAFSADLSLKDTPDYEVFPATIWTGLYVGGHIGGARGNFDVSDVNELNTIDPHANVSISTSGLLAGAQVGYNVQRGKMVYGLEADIGQMKLDGSASAHMQDEGKHSNNSSLDRDCDGNGTQQCKLDSKYTISGGLYGDITGRIGYANDKALFYVKGGAAFLKVDAKAHYDAQNSDKDTGYNSPFDFSKNETMWGWTLGAGVEYAVSRSLSLKAEYQHFDFGTMDMSYNGVKGFYCNSQGKNCAGSSTLIGSSEIDVTVDAVSVGLNYRLNDGAEALK